jgi:hypothetical protein
MDFLYRLVERQRSEQTGLRPVLPSRFEPEDPTQLQEVEAHSIPAMHASVDHRVPASVHPPGAQEFPPAAVRPAPHGQCQHAEQPDPPRHSPPRIDERAAVAHAQPRPKPPAPAGEAEAPGEASMSEPASTPKVIVVQRMIPEIAHRHAATDVHAPTPPVPPERLVPAITEDRLPTITVPEATRHPEPAPIQISIGRIEFVPASPSAEREPARVMPAPPTQRPPYRPRLTLDDYLARTDRGRR